MIVILEEERNNEIAKSSNSYKGMIVMKKRASKRLFSRSSNSYKGMIVIKFVALVANCVLVAIPIKE